MRNLMTYIASIAIAWLTATQADAAPLIFHDNFNSENGGADVNVLNYAGFEHWNVTRGTVDLLNSASCLGRGQCVDLDGSTRSQGTMMTRRAFPGGRYELSFNVSGGAGNPPIDTNSMRVSIGSGYAEIFTADAGPTETAPFIPITRNLFLDTSVRSSLAFQSIGLRSDNGGNFIDDVRLINTTPLDDVIRGAVRPSVERLSDGRQRMVATFSPALGFTLPEVAALGDYHHFNWANIVVIDPLAATDPGLRDVHGRQPRVAYFDPVAGGYQYQSDLFGRPLPVQDSLYWYLDEEFTLDGVRVTSAPGLSSELDLMSRDSNGDALNDSLLFADAPCSAGELEFYTALVGVDASGRGTFFAHTAFRWGTRPSSEGCSVFRRAFDDFEGTNNAVEFLGFVGNSPLPPDVISLLDASNIIIDYRTGAALYEPSTFALFGFGIIAILFRSRKSRSLAGRSQDTAAPGRTVYH